MSRAGRLLLLERSQAANEYMFSKMYQDMPIWDARQRGDWNRKVPSIWVLKRISNQYGIAWLAPRHSLRNQIQVRMDDIRQVQPGIFVYTEPGISRGTVMPQTTRAASILARAA